MSKSRITTSDIGIWIYDWNEAYPDIKVGYSAWENHVEIYLTNEHGGIVEVLGSGRTAREAWEEFRSWKRGFQFGKEYVNDNLGEGKR